MEVLANAAPAAERPRSKVALVMASVTGAAAVGLTVISWPFVSPAFRKVCLPYVPATTDQVLNVLRALKGRSGPLVDLGSGDGRIVIAAAAVGFRSLGVELNPWLVLFSKLWARRERLSPLATFRRADLFSLNLGLYQNVVVFGVRQMIPARLPWRMAGSVRRPLRRRTARRGALKREAVRRQAVREMVYRVSCNKARGTEKMPRLEIQLSRQLPVTGCVMVCRFPLPTWRPAYVIGEGADAVYVYFRPRMDDEETLSTRKRPSSRPTPT